MRENLLVLGASRGLGFSIGVLIKNIQRISPHTFSEVVIFSEDLTLRDKEIIGNFLPTKFIEYIPPVPTKNLRRSLYLKYFTPFVLSKMEAFRYVKDYETVTWIDTDVVVLKNLSPLLASTTAPARFMLSGTLREQLLAEISAYPMNYPAIAAGVFSISRNLGPYEDIYFFAAKFIAEHANLLYLPEQAALTAAFHQFQVKIDPLIHEKFAPHPLHYGPSAIMLHAYGPHKFWSGIHSVLWNENYASWLAEGGSPIPRFTAMKWVKRTHLKTRIRFQRAMLDLTQRTQMKQVSGNL